MLPRGVRPRLEGKQRTPLSSGVATRISWCPLSGLKGVQPPLHFGERTRDYSPGKAGKERPHLARSGASQEFPRAAAPVGVFSQGTTRISGSLSCCARLLGKSMRTSLVAQTIKHLPTVRETWVQSLGQEDPLEKEMATHSSTLAWKIPWTKECSRLQSMGSQRAGRS